MKHEQDFNALQVTNQPGLREILEILASSNTSPQALLVSLRSSNVSCSPLQSGFTGTGNNMNIPLTQISQSFANNTQLQSCFTGTGNNTQVTQISQSLSNNYTHLQSGFTGTGNNFHTSSTNYAQLQPGFSGSGTGNNTQVTQQFAAPSNENTQLLRHGSGCFNANMPQNHAPVNNNLQLQQPSQQFINSSHFGTPVNINVQSQAMHPFAIQSQQNVNKEPADQLYGNSQHNQLQVYMNSQPKQPLFGGKSQQTPTSFTGDIRNHSPNQFGDNSHWTSHRHPLQTLEHMQYGNATSHNPYDILRGDAALAKRLSWLLGHLQLIRVNPPKFLQMQKAIRQITSIC